MVARSCLNLLLIFPDCFRPSPLLKRGRRQTQLSLLHLKWVDYSVALNAAEQDNKSELFLAAPLSRISASDDMKASRHDYPTYSRFAILSRYSLIYSWNHKIKPKIALSRNMLTRPLPESDQTFMMFHNLLSSQSFSWYKSPENKTFLMEFGKFIVVMLIKCQ